MTSLMFPTTIVDDFLDEPQHYVELANNLEYKSSENGFWPGVRSRNLFELYPNMMNRIINKIMLLFYNVLDNQNYINWKASAFFQILNNDYQGGWVHRDNDFLTSIIYFCDSGVGTTLYKIKDSKTFNGNLHNDNKNKSYLNTNLIESCSGDRQQHNNQFEKTISVDSRFNRLFTFESGELHGVENFITTNNDRLTMVIFISNLDSNKFPIPRSKNF